MTIQHELRDIKIKSGKLWEKVTMSELKQGDKFRMWEPDGTIIRHNNKYVMVATTDAKLVDHEGAKVWGIEIE